MITIAIDGACRRNGKPDCVASGGVFIEHYDEEAQLVGTKLLSNYETGSTNQRGELLALITALDYAWSAKQPTQIITDSEYIFNAMTKEWFVGWESRGWLTAAYEPVKNNDLWRAIKQVYDKCRDEDVDITFYHIKGHCISFGKVTANTLLTKDTTGMTLLNEVYKKYDATALNGPKAENIKAANVLSVKNNGFEFTPEIIRHFVVINTVADAIATKCVDAADALMD